MEPQFHLLIVLLVFCVWTHSHLVATRPKNGDPTPLHRFYWKETGVNMYTTNVTEIDTESSLYTYEGMIGKIYKSARSDTSPLYHYMNLENGDNFYTTDTLEVTGLTNGSSYNFQRITGFVYPKPEDDLIPLYQSFDSNRGLHFYTTDATNLTTTGERMGYKFQKIQAYIWPLAYEEISINAEHFLLIRQEFEKDVEAVTQLASNLKKLVLEQRRELQEMRANPVPVGFVYTQYPDDPRPQELWPNVRWADITWAYAGLFFRAGGAGAAAADKIQEQNTPRIDKVNFSFCNSGQCSEVSDIGVQEEEGWTRPVVVGNYKKDGWSAWEYLQFHVGAGELRPRNRAISIFKRIA